MKTQYVTLVGTTPKVIGLDNNIAQFNVSIRPASGVTVELSLEDPADSVAPNNYTPPASLQAPVWVAAPAPGTNGIIVLKDPYAAVRFTPTTGGICSILQQGVV